MERELRARRVEEELRRAQTETRAHDTGDDDDLYEQAASLVRQHGFQTAVRMLLKGEVPGYHGLTNGHRAVLTDERGEAGMVIEHGSSVGCRVLGVR